MHIMKSKGRDEEANHTVLGDGFDPTARNIDRSGEHSHVTRVEPASRVVANGRSLTSHLHYPVSDCDSKVVFGNAGN